VTGTASDTVLDNPVWTSMRDAHPGLADVVQVGSGRAGRYHHDVSPFGGVEDPANPDCWEALGQVLDGHWAALILDPASIPEDWEVMTAIPGVQMDGTALEPAEDHEAVVLTDEDVPDMLALVERTRPGPFLDRTNRMGRYIGIRRDGRLVAMAGERLHPTGWTEISAVCTDESCRAQGLGTRLVRAVAAGIRSRGERPFLHASVDNHNAIRLYQSLGFTLRATPTFNILRRP